MTRLLMTPVALAAMALPAWAQTAEPASGSAPFGVPVEFVLFALTLLSIALFHNRIFQVAAIGLATITAYKLAVTGFAEGPGLTGLARHMAQEWVVLANLFALLMGFGILARHFEKSHVPVILPKYLPDGRSGAFLLLVMVAVMSTFLDNIASAMIGGAMAHQMFRARVHIGYLAAIVAAANAGGSFSVLGDTTTTMMWIAGASPVSMLDASIGAAAALVIIGYFASGQQQAYSPIMKTSHAHTHVDWPRLFIVLTILLCAMATNIYVNSEMPDRAESFPFLGAAVWAAIVVTIPIRRHDWEMLGESLFGTLFLISLVTAASMMPVETLPHASWTTAFGLGAVSSVFDNIPLTALAIHQDGYDWGVLAFAVGFGGSMVWFGSSAGVALSNMFPEAKSVGSWVRHGWHVPVAYIAGFFAILMVLGWYGSPIDAPLQAGPFQAAAQERALP